MEIHLKINDVRGQDERGRHILWVNDEDLREWLEEHAGYVAQNIIAPMLKKHPAKLSEILDDPTLRNVIYMQEKVKREKKAEQRERHRLFEIERQRKLDRQRQTIAEHGAGRSVLLDKDNRLIAGI